jgi:hypothetical protein
MIEIFFTNTCWRWMHIHFFHKIFIQITVKHEYKTSSSLLVMKNHKTSDHFTLCFIQANVGVYTVLDLGHKSDELFYLKKKPYKRYHLKKKLGFLSDLTEVRS